MDGERDILHSLFIFSLNPLSFVFLKTINIVWHSEYTHELGNTMKYNFMDENGRQTVSHVRPNPGIKYNLVFLVSVSQRCLLPKNEAL